MTATKRIAPLLAATLLAGCAAPGRYVYVASDTVLGVIGAMNTAQTSGKLIIGYDRKFIAVVPKKNAAEGQPPDQPDDAMAVFNCTHLEIEGIKVTKFYERIATGNAATALASELPPGGSGRECQYPDVTTTANEEK